MAIVFLVGLASACNDKEDEPRQAPQSAAQIVAGLKAKGLPIAGTIDFTAENDPDKLLGRPGQYISKTDFHDSRIFAIEAFGISVQTGGGVEVFPTKEDATRRREVLEAIAKTIPFLNEYDYQRDTVVLRLSRSLTPDQAQAYAEAFLK